ncbi:Corticotropin-releasing factor receptor 1 [Manis javanica]|nr:Corticotropin-releasing factor receptor 1 [Manis javanica]
MNRHRVHLWPDCSASKLLVVCEQTCWPRSPTWVLGSETAPAMTFNSTQRFAQVHARGPGDPQHPPDPMGPDSG